MIRYFVLLLLIALVSSPAEARGHRHYHHHFRDALAYAPAGPVQPAFGFFSFGGGELHQQPPMLFGGRTHSAAREFPGHSRPSDCYGIAWCGCYLRHYFGLHDRSLNLARRWASVGHRAGPHTGAIVVWSHHVGVMKSDVDAQGRALVLSGNDGHGVRLRLRYVGRAIAFREL